MYCVLLHSNDANGTLFHRLHHYMVYPQSLATSVWIIYCCSLMKSPLEENKIYSSSWSWKSFGNILGIKSIFFASAHFENERFSQVKAISFPHIQLVPWKHSLHLFIITSTWAGSSASCIGRSSRLGFPPSRSVWSSHPTGVSMSSEELLKAGGRLLDPYVTLDGRTMCVFICSPRRFLNKSSPAMLWKLTSHFARGASQWIWAALSSHKPKQK